MATTAFRAELEGNRPGPNVTIMVEYDALPNGHSCGHNLIASSGLAAATGLAAVMKNNPGRIVVIGIPAEEASAGMTRDSKKTPLLRNGGREASAPALSAKIPAPYDSKWTGRAPRPGRLLAFTPVLHS